MTASEDEKPTACNACTADGAFKGEFSMAFQPIVDIESRETYAYEALIRGVNGEPAPTILSQVDETNRYNFDQRCRRRAIEIASRLGLDTYLSINFMPNAVYQAEHCVQSTLKAAREFDFPTDKIIFEFTESERISDFDHVLSIIRIYRSLGFRTALDDFGNGYAGLGWAGLGTLAELQPDIVKIDRGLIRDIDQHRAKQAVVRGSLLTCRDLDIEGYCRGRGNHRRSAMAQEPGRPVCQARVRNPAGSGFRRSLSRPDSAAIWWAHRVR